MRIVDIRFVNVVRIGDLAANGTLEAPIFVSSRRCKIVKIEIVNASDLAKSGDDVNYRQIEIINYGNAGTGTTAIATWHNKSTGGSALAAKVAKDLSVTETELAAAAHVLGFKASIGGTGGALDELLVAITWQIYGM